jgi:hypothetical protein
VGTLDDLQLDFWNVVSFFVVEVKVTQLAKPSQIVRSRFLKGCSCLCDIASSFFKRISFTLANLRVLSIKMMYMELSDKGNMYCSVSSGLFVKTHFK